MKNANDLLNMFTNTPEVVEESHEYDKTNWLTIDGLRKITFDAVGTYQFDVLQTHLTIPYHPFWFKKGYREQALGDDFYWFDRPVTVHEMFGAKCAPLVCERTWGRPKNGFDSVCKYLWDNKDNKGVEYAKFNRQYSVMILRVYPNEQLGITEPTLCLYIDTKGKFSTVLYEEYDACIQARDLENLNFFSWGDEGKTLKVRFTEQTKNIAGTEAKWIGATKIDFVDRKSKLTDKELKVLKEIDIDASIKRTQAEEFDKLLNIITGEDDQEYNEAPTRAVPSREVPKHAEEADDNIEW